jgi:multidrug efflux system membrane fusion protein
VSRPVKMMTVASGDGGGEARSYPGQVRASKRVALAFKVSGPLVELPAEEGSRVRKGDLLAKVDPRDFETRVVQVESQIGEAGAQLEAMKTGARPEDLRILEAVVDAAKAYAVNAEQQYERYRDLFVKRQVSKADFDRYRSEYDMARASYNTAAQNLEKGQAGARKEDIAAMEAKIRGLESQLKGARDALGDTSLRAPFDGLVAQRFADNFAEVRAKEPIVSLQDISIVEVLVDVPEMVMATLRQGDNVKVFAEFVSAPGRQFDLVLKEFTTEADQRTQTYQVTLTMDQPEGVNIFPGMTGTVTAVSEAAAGDAVMVPAAALAADKSGSSHIWVVDPDSMTVSLRPVTTGALTGSDSILVTEGLRPGETIAVSAVSTLRKGMKVSDLSEIEGYDR